MMIKANKILAVILAGLLWAGCSSAGEAPDVSGLGEIRAVSREEGSGTRAEFESLTGADGKGTDVIALSADEVISLTAESKNAVGYLAYSSLDESKGAKAVAIDGVLPDRDSIEEDSYPLCRSYYIAYSGELNDVETDFMNYVLTAGQAVIEEYALPVNKSATFLSDKSSGTIKAAGSSSVAPIITVLAESYKEYNPNAEITVEVTDSTQGLTAAMRGECDLALSSRALKDYEEELLTKKAIARDAIAVTVNAENPVTSLTTAQLKKIYSGEAESWQDLF
ncbi:MAG: substrate-binding domain-containing protein [Clostridiales bacterium]|nr:substrate-binding domain-containing protein [Clostridiales bacterium]